MQQVKHGPGRLVLIRYENPSLLVDAQRLAASIITHAQDKAPAKAILCADFRTDVAFTADVMKSHCYDDSGQ